MAYGLGLLKGLGNTMKNMLRGPITVRYPHERVTLPERSRWAVRHRFDEDGNPMCTACTNCVRACPDKVLSMEVTTAEDKSKHIDHYTYEIGACMFCGHCVEACNFDALEMGDEYELAVFDRADLYRVLLKDVDARTIKREPRPAPASQPAQAESQREPLRPPQVAKPATEGTPQEPTDNAGRTPPEPPGPAGGGPDA